jgi:nitroreductase
MTANSTSAKPAKAAKPKPKAKTAKGEPTPLELVKPLIRVRQMRDFSGKRVTNAEMQAITEVARWSGSSRNEQPCRFVALRNKTVIREIAELGLPQTRGLPTANAAIAIIVPDEPERELSRAFDDGRAAERILVAANLIGLGGGISRVRKDVREGINTILHLPSNRSVRTIVAIGHPSVDALEPKAQPGKARLPREDVVYAECWPDPPKPAS